MGDGGLDIELRRRVGRALQHKSQCHGEAFGMGGSDQFFGVGTLLVSNLILKEYGVSASTPESVERFPLPARPVPRHTAFALRIMLHVLAVACS